VVYEVTQPLESKVLFCEKNIMYTPYQQNERKFYCSYSEIEFYDTHNLLYQEKTFTVLLMKVKNFGYKFLSVDDEVVVAVEDIFVDQNVLRKNCHPSQVLALRRIASLQK
jgi:hypothetical protein